MISPRFSSRFWEEVVNVHAEGWLFGTSSLASHRSQPPNVRTVRSLLSDKSSLL